MIDSLVLNPQAAPTPGAGDPNVNDEAFLPRILSIFYATFDVHVGPKIVYQVPENSIRVSPNPPDSARSPNFPVGPRSPTLTFTPNSVAASDSSLGRLGDIEPISLGATGSIRSRSAASTAAGDPSPATTHAELVSTPESSIERPSSSPFLGGTLPLSGITQSRPPALAGLSTTTIASTKFVQNTALLDFDSISEYVIPKTSLCGRLVHCNTPKHRILGFPVILQNDQYNRRDFRYNLCFVFDRWADLSCYEPVVRKCATVLMSCEEESAFLSNPQTSGRIYSILEQLYEDLNSYSETSIRIDSFNSIELKLFPFYPNPPKVDDWQVPVALISLSKRVESNWDLTMAKIVPHINGVNHVRKIADLADTDPNLTRRCMEHLLFYQCVLMVDIFQYSNLYAMKPSIQWLAEDVGVSAECGSYVTRNGVAPLSWPQLLRLYSRLKRGKTVHDWVEENDIISTGIDVRRFLSFGVIKGFLRRIHRYPVLMPRDKNKKKRGGTSSASRVLNPEDIEAIFGVAKDAGIGGAGSSYAFGDSMPISASVESGSSLATVHAFRIAGRSVGMTMDPSSLSPPTFTPNQYFPRARPRQGSVQSTLSAINMQHPSQPYHASTASITSSNLNATAIDLGSSVGAGLPGSWKGSGDPPTPVLSRNNTRNRTTSISRIGPNTNSGTNMTTISLAGNGGAAGSGGSNAAGAGSEIPLYPEDLPALLDGTHHTDELCSRYGIGWKELQEFLWVIGWGPNATPPLASHEAGPPDLGRVRIVYR